MCGAPHAKMKPSVSQTRRRHKNKVMLSPYYDANEQYLCGVELHEAERRNQLRVQSSDSRQPSRHDIADSSLM